MWLVSRHPIFFSEIARGSSCGFPAPSLRILNNGGLATYLAFLTYSCTCGFVAQLLASWGASVISMLSTSLPSVSPAAGVVFIVLWSGSGSSRRVNGHLSLKF